MVMYCKAMDYRSGMSALQASHHGHPPHHPPHLSLPHLSTSVGGGGEHLSAVSPTAPPGQGYAVSSDRTGGGSFGLYQGIHAPSNIRGAPESSYTQNPHAKKRPRLENPSASVPGLHGAATSPVYPGPSPYTLDDASAASAYASPPQQYGGNSFNFGSGRASAPARANAYAGSPVPGQSHGTTHSGSPSIGSGASVNASPRVGGGTTGLHNLASGAAAVSAQQQGSGFDWPVHAPAASTSNSGSSGASAGAGSQRPPAAGGSGTGAGGGAGNPDWLDFLTSAAPAQPGGTGAAQLHNSHQIHQGHGQGQNHGYGYAPQSQPSYGGSGYDAGVAQGYSTSMGNLSVGAGPRGVRRERSSSGEGLVKDEDLSDLGFGGGNNRSNGLGLSLKTGETGGGGAEQGARDVST